MLKKIDMQKFTQLVNTSNAFLRENFNVFLLRFRPFCKKIYEYFFTNKEQVIKVLLPLIIICVGFYACTSSQKMINKNIKEIFSISDQIRNYYANKPDYWGLSTTEIVQKKIIADKFLINGKIIISGHKEILLGQGKDADIVMPRSSSFDIILPKLTKAQCMAYAEKKLSAEDEVKLIGIQIINDKNSVMFEWGGTYNLPIKKYASKDICSDSNNTLIWSVK